MSEKAVDSDFESLDALERTFQKVLMEVMADKSLDAFRTEYERIHDALVQCHTYNGHLVNHVKALNEEIIANSLKVNSVLKLSRDDQKTISGLRFEFDKAWRMVELAEERENKSKDIIEELKAEVAKLTRLIEADGAKVFGPVPTTDELERDVQGLQRELKMYRDQVQTMTADIKSGREKRAQDLKTIEELTNEHENMTNDITEQGNVRGNVDQECRDMMKEVMDLKKAAQEAKDAIEDNDEKKKCQKQKIVDLDDLAGIEKKAVKEAEDENQSQQGRMRLMAKRLDAAKEQRERSWTAIEEAKKKIANAEKEVADLKKELDDVTKETDDLQGVVDAMQKQREEVGVCADQTRKKIVQMKDEIVRLTREIVKGEANVATTTMAVDGLQKKKAKTRKAVLDEKKKTKMVKNQGTDVLNDILGTKKVAHVQRKAISDLSKETDRYQRQTSNGKSNESALKADKKFKEKENAALSKELQSTQKMIGRQKMLTDIALQQRDFVLNQIKDMQEECSRVEDGNKSLHLEIKELKELMRDKDEECVEIHLKRQNIDKLVKQLTTDVAALKLKVDAAQEEQSTLENRLVKSRYVTDVAERDVQSLRRENAQLESSVRTLERSVHNKVDECSALRQKSGVLCATISAEGETYTRKNKQVQDLLEELQSELAKQQTMQDKTYHLQMLKAERFRLEKQTIQAQARGRALEEELEKPRCVHRWRFLENTSPDVFQMIQMTNALRNKYMVKMATLQRFQELLQKTQKDADRAVRLLGTITADERDDAVKFYSKALQRKSRQVQALSSMISGQQSTVIDSKQNVEMLKTQLRDIKGQYYSEKKASDELRSKSQTVRRSEDKKSVMNGTRFVGGGFALPSSIQRSSLSEAPRPLMTTLAAPSVVVPKVTSTGKTNKFLGGWNPKRKPLQQFLQPTVDVKE